MSKKTPTQDDGDATRVLELPKVPDESEETEALDVLEAPDEPDTAEALDVPDEVAEPDTEEALDLSEEPDKPETLVVLDRQLAGLAAKHPPTQDVVSLVCRMKDAFDAWQAEAEQVHQPLDPEPGSVATLQERVAALSPEQRAAWARFKRMKVAAGVDEKQAEWHALTEARQWARGGNLWQRGGMND